MPMTEAKHNRDNLYRGAKGITAWSPDITIEFLAAPDASQHSVNVESVLVIDAKYSSAIREHHWTGTDKYLEIRAVRSGKQVVRQHWLAFPGDESQIPHGIAMRDPTISWSTSGPSCDQTETVQGVLALSPVLTGDLENQLHGWVQPTPTAVSFVTGILRFMNFNIPDLDPRTSRTEVNPNF
jgi:hypothetical protein